MRFNEVAKKSEASQDASFIAFFLKGENYLGFYRITGDDEEPGYVNVQFEGGKFFSDDGEEEFYSLDDAPEEAKLLHYVEESSLSAADIDGYTSEHIAYQLYPDLGDPEGLSDPQRKNFKESVKELMKRDWSTLP